jgi:hypothetical protein
MRTQSAEDFHHWIVAFREVLGDARVKGDPATHAEFER